MEFKIYARFAMRLFVTPLAAVLVVSCTSKRIQRRPFLIEENMHYAAAHLEAGRAQEAAQIYQTVLYADPDNAAAAAKLEKIGVRHPCIMRPTMFGINQNKRPPADENNLNILMYPINRFLDILDIVTLQVGLQGGLYVEAHATHSLAAGVGAGGGMEIGWAQKRDLAGGAGYVAGVSVLPFAFKEQGSADAGTRGAEAQRYATAGFASPADPVYQNYRDYWGVGGRIIALLVGVRIEVHPVEAADAVAGFLFLDFLRDDVGSTKRFELTDAEIEAMEDLMKTMNRKEIRRLPR